MVDIDFLSPDVAQIRHQIRGIIDSYSHDWDLLAELSQNAVDAVKDRMRTNPGRGHIRVRVDATKNEIRFSDNGTGIACDKLPALLRPFSTNKTGRKDQIGSKGVGLKFVYSSSSYFCIETFDGSKAQSAIVEGAAAWVASEAEDSLLSAKLTSSDRSERGMLVTLKVEDKEHPIFKLSLDQLKFVLLTKTALGDTGAIFGEPFDCDVELVHVTKDGHPSTVEFDCKYLLPIDGLKPGDKLSLDEFKDWLSADRSDLEKRRKLKDKVVYHSEWTQRVNRTIRLWSCFIPSRSWWDNLNSSLNVTRDVEPDLDAEVSSLGFSSGLEVSTRGMPTGISLDLKPKGSAGYVPNFFVLIEDPELSFDIGRKSIPGRQQGLLRDIAHENFREYINRVQKYISGEPEKTGDQWDKSAEFSSIRELSSLESVNTRFARRPDTQEATVAAMFFEQLGRGKFPELRPLLSGYKKKYDLYVQYGKSDRVVEFKYSLSSLINDFNDAKKMFDQVDIAVVWEVTESDYQLSAKRGLTLSRIEETTFAAAHDFFDYRLELGMVDPILVISMKKKLELD